jgi:hypothetical protein
VARFLKNCELVRAPETTALPMADPAVVPDHLGWHHFDRLIANLGPVGWDDDFPLGPIADDDFHWKFFAIFPAREDGGLKTRTREQVAEALEALEARVEQGELSEGDYLREAIVLQREYRAVC